MKEETYWSKFADDLEERTNYIIGEHDAGTFEEHISAQNSLGKTLEVGCGIGTYSKILMRRAKHLTATDLSERMVAATKKLFTDIENVRVERADCFSLSYPDATFDTVFMANLLHVIPEPERAVREAGRVLREHGKLIIFSFTFEGMMFPNTLSMIYRYLKVFGRPSPDAHRLTVKMTRDMLDGCGFEINEAGLIGEKTKAIFAIARAA